MKELLAAVTVLVVSTAQASGPVSEYYVVAGEDGRMFKLQGASVLFDVATVGFDYPIAIASTIRTTGGAEDTGGGEYDLDGNFLGTVYDRGADDFRNNVDGTTDGTFNYMASHSTGEVTRWDSDWTNPVVLFSTGRVFDTGGITYDPTDNTLWVAGFGTTDIIEHYTLAGDVLSSFTTGVGDRIGSLALDHADGTLWFNIQFSNTFHQFSKAGSSISSETYDALSGFNILGGEFAFAVAPCPWDLDGDGTVGTSDLLSLVMSFGPCGTECPADFNEDGVVSAADLLLLLSNFGPCPGSPCVWDVNGDGVVDQADLDQVVQNMGPCKGCPEDVNGDGMVNGQDVAAVAQHFGPCP